MRYKLLSLTNAEPEREADYEVWSKTQHLADVLALPGVESGELFRLTAPAGRWQYLAIYEVETQDPQALIGEIMARSGTQVMPISESLDLKSAFMGLFEAR